MGHERLSFCGILAFVTYLFITVEVNAQEYQGITGLIQMPTAETDSAGTFRGGFYYLNKGIVPSARETDYNTFGYTIGISAWRWLELSYSAMLVKYILEDISPTPRFYNEDRHVCLKLIPLYEGHWWPSVAVGMDDLGRFKYMFSGKEHRNNYFQNIYIAATKHFDIRGWSLGAHLAYRYYPSDKNRDRRGLAGGLTLRPSFYPPLRLIAEWDGVGINAGADVLLWRHLFIQAALIHGRGFTGGIGYHYTIPF